MTKTFSYPVTYKRVVDKAGDVHWEGKQDQLNIMVAQPDFYICQSEMERIIQNEVVDRFDRRYGAGMFSATQTVKTEVSIRVRRNACLQDFGIDVAEENLSDEDVLQRAREVKAHVQDLTEQLDDLKAKHDEFNLRHAEEVD